MGIQFVAIVVVLMTILDSVQATPTVRRLSRYSRYWDQATAVDDWIDSLSDYKLSYFQDMIEKGYADALIDTFAAQHDEYGDYYDNDYYEMGLGGKSTPKGDPKHVAQAQAWAEQQKKQKEEQQKKKEPPTAPTGTTGSKNAPPHHARVGPRNRRTFRY